MKGIMVPAILMFIACTACSACSSKQLEKPRTGTLSERVGNSQGLEKIADTFITNLKSDERMTARLAKTNMNEFRSTFLRFLCAQVGSKCGDIPLEEKWGVSLSGEDFEVFMELFILSLNDVELPQKEQNDLIAGIMSLEEKFVTQ